MLANTNVMLYFILLPVDSKRKPRYLFAVSLCFSCFINSMCSPAEPQEGSIHTSSVLTFELELWNVCLFTSLPPYRFFPPSLSVVLFPLDLNLCFLSYFLYIIFFLTLVTIYWSVFYLLPMNRTYYDKFSQELNKNKDDSDEDSFASRHFYLLRCEII